FVVARLMRESTLHSLGGGELGLGQLQGVGVLEAVRVHVLAHVQRCIGRVSDQRTKQESVVWPCKASIVQDVPTTQLSLTAGSLSVRNWPSRSMASGVAIAPRASAASCRTIGCSSRFCRTCRSGEKETFP